MYILLIFVDNKGIVTHVYFLLIFVDDKGVEIMTHGWIRRIMMF